MKLSVTNETSRFGQMEIPIHSWSFEPMTKENDYSAFAALLGELDQPGIPDLLGGLSRHQLAEFPRIINAAREKGKADAYGKCVPPHIFRDLTNKLSATESQLADANRERARMSKVIAILNGTADEIRKERNDAIYRENCRLSKVLAETCGVRDGLQTEIRETRVVNDRLKAELYEAQSLLADRLYEIEETKRKWSIDKEGRRVAGEEIENAKEVARNNYARLEAQKKENAYLVVNLQTLQERNTELYKENKIHSEAHEKCQANANRLYSERHALENKLNASEVRVKECHEAIAQLTKERDAAALEISKQLARVGRRNEEIATLKKDLAIARETAFANDERVAAASNVPQPDLMPAFLAKIPKGYRLRIDHAPESVSKFLTDGPAYLAVCLPELPILDESEYRRIYFAPAHWRSALSQAIRSASQRVT